MTAAAAEEREIRAVEREREMEGQKRRGIEEREEKRRATLEKGEGQSKKRSERAPVEGDCQTRRQTDGRTGSFRLTRLSSLRERRGREGDME